MLLCADQQFGNYILRYRLGQGGMAEVWAATHTILHVQVALKVLFNTSPVLQQRLLREGRAQAALDHQNILPVRDVIDVNGSLGLILPFIAGPSLDKLLQTYRPTIDEAVAVFRAIVEGMRHTHDRGLIHRDLKPGNVLLEERRGRIIPRVADFGLVKDESEHGDTQSGAALGTLAYAAPEQLLDAATVDHRADLFSLGVILVELLSGKRPFRGDSLRELLKRFAAAPDVHGVPEAFVPLCRALLTFDANRRLSSCDVLLEQLHDVHSLSGQTPLGLHGGLAQAIRRGVFDPPPQKGTSVQGEQTRAFSESFDNSLLDAVSVVGAPPPPRNNLPAELDAFIGRAAALQTLAAHLQVRRQVSILGAGGMGKTRFALQFARDNLSHYPGGVFFCDLSEVRTLEGIVFAVGEAMGVPLRRSDPLQQLGHAIAGHGRCLIVLDNFEQLVAHAAETVAAWLKHAGAARFVVTSRALLEIDGEQEMRLAPLDDTESMALFVERASQKRRGFALTERNRDAVQQLVRMLDGLPLAIELATARIKVMSPQKMVSRMGQRFKLLATGRRNTTQRQATLRATIDWSWELLEDWERVALTQCAIFEGGFTLEAAEAVLALGEDVPHWPMDAVQSLVDRSLLRPLGENRRGEHRFGMLISIREYTLEKLSLWDTEAVDAARRRHASFYAQFGDPHALEALEGVEGASRWWTLRAEADNLLAAHRFAIHGNDVDVASSLALALSALAERQQFTIAIDALRATLNLDNIDNHDATVAQLHQRLGYLQWTRGQMDDAKTHGHNALAIYRAVGDRRGEGIVRNNLGNLCSDLGEIAAARAHYTAALAIHRAVGDRLREGNVRCSLGILHQEQGQMDDARAHYTAALAIYREAGNRRGEGIVRNNLGNLCRVLGEIAAARTHYTAAMAIHRAVGNRRGEGYVLGSLGNLHASQGRLDEARTYYTGALAAHREVGNRLSEGIVLSNLGILYFELGQLDESRAHYTDALALHQESGRRRGKGSVLGGLGLIEVIRGQVDRGRSHLKNGESILREINDQLSLGALLCNRAHAEHIAHHPDAAIEALDQARQIAHDLNVGTRSGLARRIAEVESLLDAARTT